MPLLQEHEREQRAGVLLITGDRGLAGALNSQIIRAGLRLSAQPRRGRAREQLVRRRQARRVLA